MMKKARNLRTFILSFAILIIFSWFIYKNILQETEIASETLHIAFIGPMSGSGKADGEALYRGAKLYFDQLNREGGINNKKIVLDAYDDENDKTKARQKALEIIKDEKALAVIGHYYSSCSLEGGKVYKEHGLPAITPGSTNVNVTKNNDWYFRTIFHDKLQGRFLAHYLKQVLKQDVVTIIRETGLYGSYLADVFEETAKELDVEVRYKYHLDVTDKSKIEQNIEHIVNELRQKEDAGFVFLATQAGEGGKLVKLIKELNIENHLIVPAAFASDTFQAHFDRYPREKSTPGYYTNGIYITTPLIFDTANEKAQQFKKAYFESYDEEANLRAPFAYDAALVIAEAIKNSNITGKKETLKSDRSKIKNYLAILDDSRAVEGTTGFNYFDDNGDAQKPVAIGMHKNKKIISALVQLQALRNLSELTNVDSAIEEGRVVEIDDKYMYRTNVVYVGVKINGVTELDIKNLTFKLDFYIWFRFQRDEEDDLQPQDIEFLNAVEAVELDIDSLITEEYLELARIQHRLYRVESTFKADFLPHNNYNHHTLGISFRHRNLTRDNLIYVTDVLGIGLSDEDLVKKLQKDQILSPIYNWSINSAAFFQGIIRENALGSLKYLNVPGGAVEYSQFNMDIDIINNEFSLRRVMSLNLAENILVISSIVILLLAFKHSKLRRYARMIWFLQAMFSLLLLLSSEVVLIDQLPDDISTLKLEMFIRVFDMLWWMVPAVLLHLAVEHFLWIPLETKSGRSIPRIGRRFVSFTIYLMTLLGIVAFVYDQKLTSLLATSGVIAMIIGLAIQINISNIFSGIAINIEHPFRVGDWVTIGEFEEGKVVDITWRTTRIITRSGCILSIPNSVASESAIHNYDYPDDTFWLKFIVHIHPAHSPERVQKIIRDAVMSAEVVLKVPEPLVIFRGITDWAAEYLAYFTVRDYAWRLLHEEAVWKRIWIHLNRAGIAPAIQRQEIHLFKGIKERGEEAATKPSTLLQELDLFRPFPEDAKHYLSQRMRAHRYSAGEIVVYQGDEGNSLFILVEGVVGVRVKSSEGESIEVARLGAGNVFGEMALLTGEDRTATIIAISDTYLFEITNEDIAPLMADHPEVTEYLSRILTQRQMMTQSQIHVEQDTEIEEDAVYKRFRDKIENFFGLKGAD